MDRHDGKQLFDGPTVRHALEQGKVAEVRVRQQTLQSLQLFREIIEFASHLLDATAYRPVVILGKAALNQRQVPEAEQVERRIQRLLRVMEALEQVLRA